MANKKNHLENEIIELTTNIEVLKSFGCDTNFRQTKLAFLQAKLDAVNETEQKSVPNKGAGKQ